MMSILDKIVVSSQRDVVLREKSVHLDQLKEQISRRTDIRDFQGALIGRDRINIIAEIKKASPSRGLLCPSFDPVLLARQYEESGASAISILTEPHYFQGNLDYITEVKKVVRLPILRKDFIITPYQLYEASAYGADAILLIAAILDDSQLSSFIILADKLGLAALVETHNSHEIERALKAGATTIGINNRDLATFSVDIQTSIQLCKLIPPGYTIVSESGIRTREHIQLMIDAGISAVLIGETLVTSGDIPATMKELLG